jgi:hypothetical protein
MSETSFPTGDTLPALPEALTYHGEAFVGGWETLVSHGETPPDE